MFSDVHPESGNFRVRLSSEIVAGTRLVQGIVEGYFRGVFGTIGKIKENKKEKTTKLWGKNQEKSKKSYYILLN